MIELTLEQKEDTTLEHLEDQLSEMESIQHRLHDGKWFVSKKYIKAAKLMIKYNSAR